MAFAEALQGDAFLRSPEGKLRKLDLVVADCSDGRCGAEVEEEAFDRLFPGSGGEICDHLCALYFLVNARLAMIISECQVD